MSKLGMEQLGIINPGADCGKCKFLREEYTGYGIFLHYTSQCTAIPNNGCYPKPEDVNADGRCGKFQEGEKTVNTVQW